MKIVRLLEDKSIIRFFGISLLIAPLVNNYIFIITNPEYSSSLGWSLYWRILLAGSTIEKVLSILGLGLGAAMLSGSMKLWKFVFGYLGLFIIFQISNLGTNLRSSWIHGLFFLGNLGAFIFIADQLVWKPQNKKANDKQSVPPHPVPTRPQKEVRYFSKKVFISIPGLGKSGQIIGLSRETLSLRLDRFPENLKLNARFDFSIQKVSVRAKVESINHQDVVLRFETESIPFNRAISQWQSSLSKS